MTELTDATVEFGVIPHDHWYQPDSIDEEKASAAREQMAKNNVIYGGRSKALVSPAQRLKPDLTFSQAVYRKWWALFVLMAVLTLPPQKKGTETCVVSIRA